MTHYACCPHNLRPYRFIWHYSISSEFPHAALYRRGFGDEVQELTAAVQLRNHMQDVHMTVKELTVPCWSCELCQGSSLGRPQPALLWQSHHLPSHPLPRRSHRPPVRPAWTACMCHHTPHSIVRKPAHAIRRTLKAGINSLWQKADTNFSHSQ